MGFTKVGVSPASMQDVLVSFLNSSVNSVKFSAFSQIFCVIQYNTLTQNFRAFIKERKVLAKGNYTWLYSIGLLLYTALASMNLFFLTALWFTLSIILQQILNPNTQNVFSRRPSNSLCDEL